MANIQKLNSMSEQFTENELSKLKIMLKHLQETFKIQLKWQKLSKQKTFRFKRKLKVYFKLQHKLEKKIIKLKTILQELRETLREKRRKKRLKLRTHLRHLKEMSEVRKSVRKIYLRELKTHKAKMKRAKKLPKKERLNIKRIKRGIQKMREKLDELDENIVGAKSKIKYFRERSRAMDPLALKKPIKATKRKLRILKGTLKSQQQFRDLALATGNMVYQESPAIKIMEFQTQTKERGLDSLKISEFTTSKSLLSSGMKESTSDFTREKVFKKKTLGTSELSPNEMEKRANDAYKDSITRKKSKKRFKKPKTSTNKLIEPLPIGDKAEDSEDKKQFSKRFSKRYLRRKSQLKRSLSSQGDYKTPTTTNTSAESEAAGLDIKKSLNKTKNKAKQKRILKTKSLGRLSKDSSTETENIRESLEPEINSEGTSKGNVIRVKRSSLHLDELRHKYSKPKPRKKLKWHLYRKPIDDRTLQSLLIANELKGLEFHSRNIHSKTSTNENQEQKDVDAEEPELQEQSKEDLQLKTSISLYKIKEKEIVPIFPTHTRSISRKLSSADDEKVTNKLMKSEKPKTVQRKMVTLVTSKEELEQKEAAGDYKLQQPTAKVKEDQIEDKRSSSIYDEKFFQKFVVKDSFRNEPNLLNSDESLDKHVAPPVNEDQPSKLKTGISLYNIKQDEVVPILQTPPKIFAPLPPLPKARKASTIYDEKYFQKLFKTQKIPITEKLQIERKKHLELEKEIAEKAEEEAKEYYRKSRANILRRRNTSLSDSIKMDNLVKLAMKSNYNLAEVIPENVAIIDDDMLQNVHKSHRITIKDILATADQTDWSSDLKVSPVHLPQPTTSTATLKTNKSSENVANKTKSEPQQQKIVPEDLLINESNDELGSEVNVDDLIKSILAKQAEQQKDIVKKPKRMRKSKKKQDVREQTTTLDRCRKLEMEEKEEVKIICSCCGMTNMQPGGPCCPLVPKKK